jgi:hypothetical protein
MPKTTHQHQKDAMNTDKKFRPEDEHLYAREKQEFQESEKAEKAEGAEIAAEEQQKSSQNPDETGEK